MFKTTFLQKLSITFEVNRDRRTRCTNSLSNLILKCNANTFVKLDTQIEETADGLSPICKGILAQSRLEIVRQQCPLFACQVSQMC